jgi:protein involved in polysaccharide export with SLBB domain
MNKYLIIRCIMLLLAIGSSILVQSQDISSADLTSINIDELSDDQIKKFMAKAAESGLTQDQLELLAQQKGMSSLQISKLRTRIADVEANTDKNQGISAVVDRSREQVKSTEDHSFFSEIAPQLQDRLRIFGSDIFSKNTISFVPDQNVATPVNYVLGPGDGIIIDIYGSSEITYQKSISPDGQIFIAGVGPIGLSGITIEEARKRIFNKLSLIYAGLKGQNPNTFLQISLGSIRTIKVDLVGFVENPGTYSLSSFSTAFNALYAAGGPSSIGSMRNIEVIRNGEKIATFDVYKYFFEGDIMNNPRLRDEDVIVVKSYLNRVVLDGAVKLPAIYELTEQETLGDLLQLSGGFAANAYTEQVKISRKNELRKQIKSVKSENFDSEPIQSGDLVFVSENIDRYTNRVRIEGAVNLPDFYELTENLTLLDLIDRAEGLREDVYMGRGNIIRLEPDFSLSNISFDLRAVINGEQNHVLIPEDIVRIPSIGDIEEEKYINIKGEVGSPGQYPYISGMTVEDLLNISSGLRESANTSFVEISRRVPRSSDVAKASEVYVFPISRNLLMSDSASNFLLEPFDLVTVKATSRYRKQKMIRIEGEVLYPGFYSLETNDDRLIDLIERAGGFTDNAYPTGASLIRERQDIGETTDPVEAATFRRLQLNELIKRDDIDAIKLTNRESIGIELNKAIQNPDSKYNMLLQDGDLISVPKELQTVRVQGEVLYSTNVQYDERNSFKEYVSLSGGFTSEAKIGKSYIVYANGRAQRTKNFLFFRKFPKVKPGADIFIPTKEVRRSVGVQEILGLTSSLATIALIIDRLSN